MRRYTVEPTFQLRLRLVLPWCGLILVLLTAAEGTRAVAASLLLPPVPVQGIVSSNHEPAEGSGAVILLDIWDRTTATQTRYLCLTTREDRVTADVVFLNSDGARDVAQAMCDSLTLAPEPGRGTADKGDTGS